MAASPQTACRTVLCRNETQGRPSMVKQHAQNFIGLRKLDLELQLKVRTQVTLNFRRNTTTAKEKEVLKHYMVSNMMSKNMQLTGHWGQDDHDELCKAKSLKSLKIFDLLFPSLSELHASKSANILHISVWLHNHNLFKPTLQSFSICTELLQIKLCS